MQLSYLFVRFFIIKILHLFEISAIPTVILNKETCAHFLAITLYLYVSPFWAEHWLILIGSCFYTS